MSTDSLRSRAVLVTGGSRGLGRAIALAFCAAGAHVTASGRDSNALAETQSLAAGMGGILRTALLDSCDETAVTDLVRAMPALDVVVNNAGIARAHPFLDTPTAELREMLEINVIAAFVMMREAARRMAHDGGGQIINIASDAALRGIADMAPYVASKHALLGLGRSAQSEWAGHNIRVTTLCPGGIATEIFGPGSLNPQALPPDEIARMVVHIASLPPSVAVQEVLVTPTGRSS